MIRQIKSLDFRKHNHIPANVLRGFGTQGIHQIPQGDFHHVMQNHAECKRKIQCSILFRTTLNLICIQNGNVSCGGDVGENVARFVV